MLRLLNEPSFLLYIGDKGVKTVNDAEAFLVTGPMASYEQHGFGLYRVAITEDDTAIGICGLLSRPTLPDPDLGFAFLPDFWGHGYAYESAREILRRARRVLGLRRIVAITAPENKASISLLGRLGFEFEKVLASFGDAGKSNLYELEF
ncbi:MAG: GNAT family N-acetyltransferase [Gammaproteobacteria bacterium]|nr:GNAT family N-acetyltransferase [Gammaproteobacteria bacterium]